MIRYLQYWTSFPIFPKYNKWQKFKLIVGNALLKKLSLSCIMSNIGFYSFDSLFYITLKKYAYVILSTQQLKIVPFLEKDLINWILGMNVIWFNNIQSEYLLQGFPRFSNLPCKRIRCSFDIKRFIILFDGSVSVYTIVFEYNKKCIIFPKNILACNFEMFTKTAF